MKHKYPIVSSRGGYALEPSNSQSGYKHVSGDRHGSVWKVDYLGYKSRGFEDPGDAAHLLAVYLEGLEQGKEPGWAFEDEAIFLTHC